MVKKICFWSAILFLASLAAPPGWAFERELGEGPVNIEADSIAYDGDEDLIHASGKVVITFSGGDLKADSATLNRTTNRALAEGHVAFAPPDHECRGDKRKGHQR